VCDDAAVPLDAQQLRALFSHDGSFPDVDGAYVCFAQIPLREREGEWRFAGTATSLCGAARTLDAYLTRMEFEGEQPVLEMLDAVLDVDVETTRLGPTWCARLPAQLGEHEVVALAESGAPYDGMGVCLVRVPTLEGHPFARAKPETRRPRSWPRKKAR
jgi:hypothetical protein